MKIIRYKLSTRCNVGTAEKPMWEDVISEPSMPYSDENLEMATAIAYNGECTVEDDGRPEPVVEPTADDVLDIMLGVE